jgi:hypothetical protein
LIKTTIILFGLFLKSPITMLIGSSDFLAKYGSPTHLDLQVDSKDLNMLGMQNFNAAESSESKFNWNHKWFGFNFNLSSLDLLVL